jgi:S1-C subfamily serine protease
MAHRRSTSARTPLALLLLALAAAAAPIEESVVMIRAVTQDYDYRLPWKQLSMHTGTGSGLVIAGPRILTNAHNVSNAKYVEVRQQGAAPRSHARVAVIGHDCDLAVLIPLDMSFFRGVEPLPLGSIPAVNTTVSTYGFPVGGAHVSVTEGVVSRIQVDLYSHTGADRHLVIQTDAAINPGNSGGPVMQDGTVVGVAFQGMRQAENIGYLIPTTVIEHFLKDIEDGTYDGYGSLGFSHFAGLHNQSYKEYLKVPAEEEGLVVTRTLMNSSAAAILKPGDVITKIGSYELDNDGMIRIHGLRLHMSEAIEQKQMGEELSLTFFRDGAARTATLTVALNRPVLEYGRRYDRPPPYVLYAGLSFVGLSRNVLETWGSGWVTEIPDHLRYLFVHSVEINQDPQRREYVVLAEVLPDTVNEYAESFQGHVVETVNGVSIHDLSDMPGALQPATGGYTVITFMDRKRPLILDAAKAADRNAAIMKAYNVPADRRLED